jgi:hypothetical protein
MTHLLLFHPSLISYMIFLGFSITNTTKVYSGIMKGEKDERHRKIPPQINAQNASKASWISQKLTSGSANTRKHGSKARGKRIEKLHRAHLVVEERREAREAPLEVVGNPVLEPGGQVDLPFRELLLKPVARDLAQRLHIHTQIARQATG